jgi:opacity protein-like surface antigen
MIMKSLIATALVAVGLLATAVAAQAATDFPGYPDWAQQAFDNKG